MSRHAKIKISKIIIGILLFAVVLLLSLNFVNAESKYTREKSEKLFHLINWHEYKPETFNNALKEQKPIFLVISAPAWCYWCHVYESEDYLYNPILYPYINENFIPIFVDSDKRPDLTRKYLEGGWPSTTIFTPDFIRIAGYTGPREPKGLRDYFEKVVAFLKDKKFSEFGLNINYESTPPKIPELNELIQYENNYLAFLANQFDKTYGGFRHPNLPEWREGQKFPSGFAYKYLLEKYEETGNEDYLNFVKLTFDNQYTDITELKSRYRLYDPVEGGFHRYSTKRDWSIPHYEKHLSDQAKLLRAYAHLLKITNDSKVGIAVNGTISFIITKFLDYDDGFYSSQDAYLESGYFGLTKEERSKINPPYIDKTRKIDENSMMISTFIYLYKNFQNAEHKGIAKRSLDFIQKNMVSNNGAYYYFDYDKKMPFLTGQSLANSWAILDFADGYELFKEEHYIKTAIQIAEYSLINLYDWNSGGFFTRNSKDIEFYAPNERIDLSKSYEENAVFSYGMLKLYLITGNLEYLESGMKTLGYLLERGGGFDESYYGLKASELARENNLLMIYQEDKDKIDKLIEKQKEDFFLDDLLKKQQNKISIDSAPKLKDEFSSAGFIVLAILAFTAGILSFLSPCCLPVLSAYFAHNFSSNKGEMVKNTIFFFLGLATVFSIFGMGATLIGSIFKEHRLIFSQIAGAIVIIFGILEIFGKGFSGLNIKFKSSKTPIGSYLFGGVFAIGWSACIGPILASLLLLSATSGTVLKGSLLLFIYALGLGIPLLIISIYFDKIKQTKFLEFLQGRKISLTIFKKQINIHTTYLISGIILIIIGILIFNDYLYRLNQFALQTSYVQNFIIRVEEFLKELFI